MRDKGPIYAGLVVFLVLVTFPLFLYGFLPNIIPFWLPVRLVRNIKDRQFHSSVKIGAGLLLHAQGLANELDRSLPSPVPLLLHTPAEHVAPAAH